MHKVLSLEWGVSLVVWLTTCYTAADVALFVLHCIVHFEPMPTCCPGNSMCILIMLQLGHRMLAMRSNSTRVY